MACKLNLPGRNVQVLFNHKMNEILAVLITVTGACLNTLLLITRPGLLFRAEESRAPIIIPWRT
jgi:hypothetical protein